MKNNKKEHKTKRTPRKSSSYQFSDCQKNNNIKKPNLYGLHAVREAWLNKNRVIHALYMAKTTQRQFDEIALKAGNLGLPRPDPIIIDKAKLDKILPKGAVHQGIALACDPLEEKDIQDLIIHSHNKSLDNNKSNKRSIIAILDKVTDPHNVGAIMRSASAFGIDGILMQTRHAPVLEGVLAKTACGAVEHMPVAYATNLSRALEDLKEAGFIALAMDEHAKKEIGELELNGKIAVVLGAEGTGIRPLIKKKCDVLIRLPTSGAIVSLNVSNAAAISFYIFSAKI